MSGRAERVVSGKVMMTGAVLLTERKAELGISPLTVASPMAAEDAGGVDVLFLELEDTRRGEQTVADG